MIISIDIVNNNLEMMNIKLYLVMNIFEIVDINSELIDIELYFGGGRAPRSSVWHPILACCYYIIIINSLFIIILIIIIIINH